MHHARPFLLALGASTLLVACETGDGPDQPLPPRSQCAIAVVQSDYRSTSVSLLTDDGSPCAPDLIDSGSERPGLLTALSGDVVLPQRPVTTTGGAARLALIDRYPAGTLTLVDPLTDAVTHQVGLSPGFSGNPQDLLALDGETLIATRLEAAPQGATPSPAGSDLVIMRLAPGGTTTASGELIGRLDLDTLAEPGFAPMPARLARVGDTLFVGLAHLATDFSSAGPGRVAMLPLPAATDTRILADWLATTTPTIIALPGLENCTGVSAAPDTSGVWVVCSGSFRRGSVAQTARSGLAFIDTTGAVVSLFSADTLTAMAGDTSPLGFTLTAIDGQRAVVSALGDLVSGRGDRALLVTRGASAAVPETQPAAVAVLHTTGPFDLGDALALRDGQTVLVADGNARAPKLLRIAIDSAGNAVELRSATETGLPPRSLQYIR